MDSSFITPPAGERSIAISLSVCLSVCLSGSISLESLDRSSRNLLCRSPMAVARSSLGGVAIYYVLPVLWMTLRLAVVDHMSMHGVAIPGRSLMSMNALFLCEVSCIPAFIREHSWRRCQVRVGLGRLRFLASVSACLRNWEMRSQLFLFIANMKSHITAFRFSSPCVGPGSWRIDQIRVRLLWKTKKNVF